MTLPTKLRYYTHLRRAGNSLFVLIPSLVRNFMKLDITDKITLTYDIKLKKITIRKARE